MRTIAAFSLIYLAAFFVPSVQSGLLGKILGDKDSLIDDIPTATLSNGAVIPLVGMGVGNLQANRIKDMVDRGIAADHSIRLIDTAHASNNEQVLSAGITTGVENFQESEHLRTRIQVHVVTKVWYTHLGYERTKISVLESLEAMAGAILDDNVDLKVHMLLHWPRCRDDIQWMDCEQEEKALSDEVKKAGSPPHLDRENAWKASWKALEDMYSSNEYPMLASIGVSNFDAGDLTALTEIAKVQPHVIQMNVWSLINDPRLVDICQQHSIHIQVYNVMNGIFGRAGEHPHAYHHLLMVLNQLEKTQEEGDNADASTSSSGIDAGQVTLKWLIQQDVSIIPRTSNPDHLISNSAASLSNIPTLNDDQMDIVKQAMRAMLNGRDMPDDVAVKVTFHAKNEDMFLAWFNNRDGSEKVVTMIEKGSSVVQFTHPKHRFRLYHAYDPDKFHDYTVSGAYGDQDEVHVDL